jgi:vancomycin aglycone glucosyltransferase
MLISAVGTRGDVQPALALALAARQLGCDVRLCVPPNFTGGATDLGFDAQPIGVEMRPPRPGEAPPAIPDLITDQFEAVGAAAEGCGLIVGAGAHQYAVRSVAERLGIACVVAVYAPVALPSPELAPAGFREAPPDAAAIRRLWAEHRQGWNDRALERVNANRARLGLSPVDDVLGHILGDRPWLAADPVLGPTPATPGLEVVQTGAWLLPASEPLPPEVEAFLADGPAPVYLGFGSMPAAPDVVRPLVGAVRALGRRAILSAGWAGLEATDDGRDVLTIGDVNHQALFPRLAAVVHHGGAGTTTAAALAGVAQVAAAMFSDQFYWGGRLRELGVGATLPAAELSAEALAAVLRATLEPAVAERARALAPRLRVDGAAVAARRLVDAHA